MKIHDIPLLEASLAKPKTPAPQASSIPAQQSQPTAPVAKPAQKKPAEKPNPTLAGGGNKDELIKQWIQYLKSSQIVSTKSDAKTGELNYKRKPTTADLKKFLQNTASFDDKTIDAAIKKAVSKVAPAGKVQAGNQPAQPTQAAQAGAQPGKPTQAAQAGTPPAQPNQPTQSAPAKKPRYKMGPDGKPVQISEAFADEQSAEVDEKQVEAVFSILAKSVGKASKPNTPQNAQQAAPAQKAAMDPAKKQENFNKIRTLIANSMTPEMRKSLWRALNA